MKTVKQVCAKRKQPAPAVAYLDTRLFVPVIIQAHTFHALVDTGAAKSYIGPRIQRLVADTRPLQKDLVERVQLANGQLISTNGNYLFPIQIGSQSIPFRCQGLDNLTTDVLIGLDFLLQHRAVLHVVDHLLVLNDEPVPCRNYHDAGLGGVRCISEAELPVLNEFRIPLKPGTEPVKQRYYPRNPAMQSIMDEEIDRMLRDDIIEPSRSPWSSPVVLVKKNTSKTRIPFRSSRAF